MTYSKAKGYSDSASLTDDMSLSSTDSFGGDEDSFGGDDVVLETKRKMTCRITKTVDKPVEEEKPDSGGNMFDFGPSLTRTNSFSTKKKVKKGKKHDPLSSQSCHVYSSSVSVSR